MNLLTRLLTFLLGLTTFCHFGIGNSAAVANGTFNHPNFIVYFTGGFLPSKGLIINDVEDYFPMIDKISSEFSQISCMNKTILIAVATYNKFLSTKHAPLSVNQKPLEVYFQYSCSGTGSATKFVENFVQLADKSNNIYPGTIKYLIADHSCFSKNSKFNQRWSLSETRQRFMDNSTHHTYKLGIALPLHDCEKAILEFNSTLSDIVQLVEFHSNTIKRYPTNRTVEESFCELTDQFNLCAKLAKSINPNVELLLYTGISDNDPNKKQRDYSTLITFWEMMNTWAIATNVKVIINEAFDTPDREDYRGTRGLWKLAETPRRFHIPADFIFMDRRLGNSSNISKTVSLGENNLELKDDLDFKHDNFVVVFDSNTFSKYNHHDDFLPLIRTISDRFSSVCLENFSPVVPEAFAIHSMTMQNKNRSKNSTGLRQTFKLYLPFEFSDENNLDHALNITKTANSLFPDIVKYMVFDDAEADKLYWYVTNGGKGIINQTVELAITLPLLDCLRGTPIRTRVSRLLSYVKLIIITMITEQEDYDTGVEKTVLGFTKAFAVCKKKIEIESQKQSLKFGFISGWAEMDSYPNQNLSALVSYWGKMNNWAKVTNTTVFMIEAFDEDPEEGTYGWWRLASKPRIYHSLADYIYEDKTERRSKISNGIKYAGNNTFLIGHSGMQQTWQVTNSPFSRSNFIVQFSPIMLNKHTKDGFNENQIREIILKLFTRFSSICTEGLNVPDLLHSSLRHVPLEVAKFNLERGLRNVLYLIFTVSEKEDAFLMALKTAKKANLILAGSVEYLIAIIDRGYFNNSRTQFNYIIKAKNLLKKVSLNVSYKLGSMYPISDCLIGRSLNKAAIPLIKVLDLIIFSYHPEDMDYEAGVYESFRGFTKQFEKCKDAISQLNLSIEVAFRTSWSDTSRYHGYGLENLVIFWEKMNEWAVETNTKVFMLEAFDSQNTEAIAHSKLGWWRLLSEENRNGSSNYIFEEKREVVLGNLATKKPGEGTSHPRTVLISVSSALAVSAITATLIFLFVYRKYRNKLLEAQQYILTKKEKAEFLEGSTQSAGVKLDRELIAEAHLPKYDKDYEVEREHFMFDETTPLGSGEFGIVCKGTITKGEIEINVAVKTLKKSNSPKAVKDLLVEIKVMIYLGKHENIVSVIGAHTEEMRRGNVFLFTELCEKGSLQNYLRELRRQDVTLVTEEDEANVNSPINERGKDEHAPIDPNSSFHKKRESWVNVRNALDQNLLSRWSYEIANGMEFIASKKVVHGDLATRNVLLTDNLTAKISDFGLSRRLYNYTSYVKTQKQPLPWKWMSPESLRRSEFNEKTDVWAFGITLWEIYSLGDAPYPGLSWSVNFPLRLEKGLRPQEPEFNANSIYSVMLRCWNIDPKSRPTFHQLKEVLNRMTIL